MLASSRCRKTFRNGQWITLKDVIAAGSLPALSLVAEGAAVSHSNGSFSYEMPVANGEKIICVGVNFPDRNAEYKDGSQKPANMSLFTRFARGLWAMARLWFDPLNRITWIMRVRSRL